jgi:hypothetical protein
MVSGGLAISGAIVVVIATFLPWYRWSLPGVFASVAGTSDRTRPALFSPNLYGLGSSPDPGWNSIAPVFVDAAAALLLLAGLLLLLGHVRYLRSAITAVCISVVVVVASSVMVRTPKSNWHSPISLVGPIAVPRGPGLFVALVGAALGAVSLVLLVATPVGRVTHNAAEQTTQIPTAASLG